MADDEKNKITRKKSTALGTRNAVDFFSARNK